MNDYQRAASMGNYGMPPYQPCPAFTVAVGPNGAPAYDQQAAAAAAYYQQPNAYGAYGAGYQDPYAAYYGYAGYGQQAPAAADGSQQQAAPPAEGESGAAAAQPAEGSTEGAAAATTDATNGGVDMAAYHRQFWEYAQAYGEKVARQQYGEYYSPPEGTPVPDDIKLPTEEEAAANLAKANADASQANGGEGATAASESS